jgi:hypothetical protein
MPRYLANGLLPRRTATCPVLVIPARLRIWTPTFLTLPTTILTFRENSFLTARMDGSRRSSRISSGFGKGTASVVPSQQIKMRALAPEVKKPNSHLRPHSRERPERHTGTHPTPPPPVILEAAESLAKPRTPNEGSMHSADTAATPGNCTDPSTHKVRGPSG